MFLCLVGLGSNEGDRHENLVRALEELGRQCGVRLLRQSRFLETAPVGGPIGQSPFLNAAALLETCLDPEALLAALMHVEASLGRRRVERWGPRTIDLDLLLYDELVLSSSTLVVPHPRMAWRRFVLEPAAEIASAMIHPTTGWTVARLLEHLNTAKDYVAIAGPVAAAGTGLGRPIARSVGGWLLTETPDLALIEAFCADPLGLAWPLGLESLEAAARLLAAEASIWQGPAPWWVSDYWFDQCLAFARAWLPPERRAAFDQQFAETARTVVRPKLTVVFEIAGDWPFQETGAGRPDPSGLANEAWRRMCDALETCLRRPDVGPVLRLAGESSDQSLQEVLAAMAAMK